MDELKIPEPNVSSRPTADISLQEESEGLVQNESYPVIPKTKNTEDFVRPIKMSDIKRIYDISKELIKSKIKWDQILLAVATLGFGATISALLSEI